MTKVFISNTKINGVDNIVIDKSSIIGDLFEDKYKDYKNGQIIFIIDVHCTFDGKNKLQQQGGVAIYRYLLKQFEGNQEKLKVVFYSPLSNQQLVKLKPENYILKLLPFVECKYDGHFAASLEEAIIKYNHVGWLQFNNASENLLSGWALRGGDKIDTKNKKILFIDDQQSEWKETFTAIFSNNNLLYVKNRKGEIINNQQAYRDKLNVNWLSFKELIKVAIDEKPDLILSDFYLKENHDIDKWKNVSEIKKISGFQLFEVLREYVPATPYVFHTSSNKASIYKCLDANGVDDWLIKDTRMNTSASEKIENYDEFNYGISSFLQNDIYNQIENIWNKIREIKNKEVDYYKRFPKKNREASKELIDNFLTHSWIALRRSLNREIIYENNLLKVNTHLKDWYVAVSVVNNLGKIIEYLAPKRPDNIDWDKCSSLLELAYQIRNCGSHYQDNNMLRLKDIFILFNITISLIENEEFILRKSEEKLGLVKKIKTNKGGILQRRFALFWIYLIFYNNTQTFKSFHHIINERIKEYWHEVDKDALTKDLNSELKKIILGTGECFALVEENNKFLIKRSDCK